MAAPSGKLKEPTISGVLPVQIITMLVSVSAMFVDSIIIGLFYEDEALAAYGLTSPVTLFITALGGMIGYGVQILAGESAGAGDSKKLNKIFSTSLTAGVIGSIIVVLAILLFPEKTAVLLGAKTDFVIKLTAEYLKGIVFCFPLIVCVLIIPGFLQMANGRIYMVTGTLILIVLDVIFDLLNVYVFEGGMLGMALASVASYVIGFLYIVFFYFRKGIYKFSLKDFSSKILKSCLFYGLLYLTYKMCVVLMSLAVNRILADKGGLVLVAANSIITSVNLVIGSFPSGFGSTTTMLCSYYTGKNDTSTRSAFIKKILLVSIIVNIFVALIIMIFAPTIVSLFDPESEEIKTYAELGLRLFTASVIFNTFNYIIKNASQSMKKMKPAYIICLLNDFIMPFIAALILANVFEIKYIWLCYLLGQGVTMILLLVFTVFNKRSHLYN